MINLLQFTFMQNALIVCICIAILCPCIGIFLVLRRYSLIGDTLAHASLAGVSLSLLTNQNPVLGAFIFTAICGALIEFLQTYFRKFSELILAIILSFSVGIAITLISSGRLHANADSYLFGSMLTVTTADIVAIIGLTLFSVLACFFLYHQLIYIAFDEEAARVAKVPVKAINYIFSIIVAALIAVSIRIVGVLVLSSLIALPIASALQLKTGFKPTLFAAFLFSFLAILSGLFFSYALNVAPGGLTALFSVVILLAVIIVKSVQRQFSH